MLCYSVVIAALAAYLLGNLNGAVCMSAIVANDDVRFHGSGNAGLTNFIRSYGRRSALFVVLIDAGKAVVACLCAGLLLEPYGLYREGMMLGATAVILGHDFPALLGFRGGKGILCGLAVAMTMDWRVGVALVVVFAAAYFLTQYVSLGSVLGAAVFSIGFALIYRDSPLLIAAAVFLGGLTIFMHRGNIQRLLKGEERKTNLFGKGKNP
ncbi:MAG: glycerol-3-phosphate acyltransferase [Faecousia sp.]